MNHFDNKYTNSAPQAINGALYVSEKDWTTAPIRYLRDGWRYYSGRLLTPESLALQGDDYRYVSIGENTDFAMGDPRRSPHGSVSYAMTLYLPEEEHTYTIEFPEIYSAYRLYINNELQLQMGDPDVNAYHDRTQCRVIPFVASGKTTLLLAVSDYSWVYSGLVYPPAFGEPLNLYTRRGLENAVEACQRQQTGDKTIFIAGRVQDSQLEFILDNSFDRKLQMKGRAIPVLQALRLRPWRFLRYGNCGTLWRRYQFVL